jgi:hypothetical protein
MKVKRLQKNIELNLHDIIRFQVTTYCFLNKIRISPAQLDTLAYLGEWGDMNISDFCEQIVEQDIFGNPQTVRNFILKAVKDGYVIRKGKGKKIVSLVDDFEMLSDGNILLEMKVYYVEGQKE